MCGNKMNLLEKIRKIFKKNNIVIYTAIFNDYDSLKEPLYKIKNCDFICFTDNKNLKSETYKVVVMKKTFNDPTRDARMYKALPHRFLSKYEYSIWVDGSFLIKTDDIGGMIKKNLNLSELSTFKHPDRDCIYDEAEVCIGAKKDFEDVIKKQVAKYKKEGYPQHNGLVASGVLLRKNLSKSVVDLNEKWWVEIRDNSKRDQLSFNYVAWKNNFKYGIVDGVIWENDYFKIDNHKK